MNDICLADFVVVAGRTNGEVSIAVPIDIACAVDPPAKQAARPFACHPINRAAHPASDSACAAIKQISAPGVTRTAVNVAGRAGNDVIIAVTVHIACTGHRPAQLRICAFARHLKRRAGDCPAHAGAAAMKYIHAAIIGRIPQRPHHDVIIAIAVHITRPGHGGPAPMIGSGSNHAERRTCCCPSQAARAAMKHICFAAIAVKTIRAGNDIIITVAIDIAGGGN